MRRRGTRTRASLATRSSTHMVANRPPRWLAGGRRWRECGNVRFAAEGPQIAEETADAVRQSSHRITMAEQERLMAERHFWLCQGSWASWLDSAAGQRMPGAALYVDCLDLGCTDGRWIPPA